MGRGKGRVDLTIPFPHRPLLLFLALSAGLAEGKMVHLYVSQSGKDAFTGRAASPVKGKSEGPFRTLERARDEIRRLKKTNALPDGAMVHLRAGRYEIGETFRLRTDVPNSSSAMNR
jgi:spore maturation protein SpmB